MPSTSAKGLEVQVTGSNAGTWGTVLNDNMISYVDTFLGGITSLSLSSTGVALTQAQCRNVMLRMTGALLAGIVIQPDVGVLLTGFVYWENLTTNSQTVTFTNTGGSVVLPQGRRGVMWVDTANGPRVIASIGSSQTDVIPAGSSMLFYNSAAPTGWSAVALTDYAIRVAGTGGVTFGTIPYSTWWNRTATDSHTLTVSEIPAHTHTYSQVTSGVTTPNISVGGGAFATGTTSSTGGGAGHTHDFEMRVATLDFVLASRN